MPSESNFEALVRELKYRSGKSERELAEKMGYRSGYLTEARSRGTIPEKLILRLKAELEKYNQSEQVLSDSGEVYQSRLDRLIGIIESQQSMLSQQQNTIHILVNNSYPEKGRKSA